MYSHIIWSIACRRINKRNKKKNYNVQIMVKWSFLLFQQAKTKNNDTENKKYKPVFESNFVTDRQCTF